MAKKTKYYSSDKFCVVTGTTPVDLHHWTSRGAGGTDDTWNLMPLAHHLHVEVHTIGKNTFAEKYEGVRIWLRENNWEWNQEIKEWERCSQRAK